MGRYLVTEGSYFDPFTYDEMMKPIQLMTERHEAADDMYAKLGEESATLADYIPEDTDSLVKQRYDAYQAQLKQLQDNLWKSGYSAQTRRDLAAARAGFQKDITRIASAVEARKKDSELYNKIKVEQPDRVLGADPRGENLDNYFKDENYGGKWFSYSGNDFTKEVAADAKARASELLRNPEIVKHPNIPGYIQEKVHPGFTNDEVDHAYEAVYDSLIEGNDSKLSNLTAEEKILADVLQNHIKATGAVRGGNLSDSEYERLLRYGRDGLAEAVGQTKVETLNDKVWEHKEALRLEREKYKINHPAGDDSLPTGKGYTTNEIIRFRQSLGYDALAKSMKSQYKHYSDGAKMIQTPDGKSAEIDSPWGMTMEVYNPEVRQKARRLMGVDIALPLSEDTKIELPTENGMIKLTAKKISRSDADKYGVQPGTVVFYEPDGTFNSDATNLYYNAKERYNQYVKDYESANEKTNLSKMAITPKQEKEYRDKYNIPNSVDTADIPHILDTIESVTRSGSAQLVGSDSPQQVRTVFSSNMFNTLKRANIEPNSETSLAAVYPVGARGAIDKKKGTTDVKKVFGDNEAVLQTVDFSPESIAQGARANGGKRPGFTFTTEGTDGVWYGDISILGENAEARLLEGRRGYYPTEKDGYTWNLCDAVNYIMLPLLEPQNVMSWSDEEAESWAEDVMQLLNEGNDSITSDTFRGAALDYNGMPVVASAKDIVRNKYFQNQLRAAAIQLIREEIADERDIVADERQQQLGSTSSNPARYNK